MIETSAVRLWRTWKPFGFPTFGHEKVQTTMDTYSHLYPNKQVEVAKQLDGLMQ